MTGFLVSFEGIDGSGKSTQARLVYDRLVSDGYAVQLLREPGNTVIGEKIRSILLDTSHSEMSPYAELFLYLAARAQITSQIIAPALEKGDIVIMDRYIDSTTSYQGFARGLGMEKMTGLNKVATNELVPDVTFVVDCDPETASTRVGMKPDRLESEGIGFMREVRKGFLDLCESDDGRVKYIDGGRAIEVIHEEIIELLMPMLNR